MDSTHLSSGDKSPIPGNAYIEYQNTYIRKALGASETVKFIITFGSGVGASLVATWLYNKLKGRMNSLRINRRIVELDKGEIARVIEEEIDFHK